MRMPSSACMGRLQDLARTFPANVWMRTEEGQAALRRVLLAFSVHQPQVGGMFWHWQHVHACTSWVICLLRASLRYATLVRTCS